MRCIYKFVNILPCNWWIWLNIIISVDAIKCRQHRYRAILNGYKLKIIEWKTQKQVHDVVWWKRVIRIVFHHSIRTLFLKRKYKLLSIYNWNIACDLFAFAFNISFIWYHQACKIARTWFYATKCVVKTNILILTTMYEKEVHKYTT